MTPLDGFWVLLVLIVCLFLGKWLYDKINEPRTEGIPYVFITLDWLVCTVLPATVLTFLWVCWSIAWLIIKVLS